MRTASSPPPVPAEVAGRAASGAPPWLVSIVHAGILLGQIAAGVLLSGDAALWVRTYVVFAAVLVGGILGAAAAADWLFSATGSSLQPRKAPASKLRAAEAFESARAMVVFAGFAAWPRMLLLQGRPTALQWSLAAAQPGAPTSLALYAAKLLCVTLATDAYMYAKHRALHAPALYAFHRQHHAFHNPTPFASFAVAPLEAVATFAPVLLLCLPSAPIWAAAYAAWVLAFVALNLYLHAGHELPALERALRAVGLNSSAFHNVHHESGGVRNFGELLFVWDALLGSGAHPRGALEDAPARKGGVAGEDAAADGGGAELSDPVAPPPPGARYRGRRAGGAR